MWYVTRAAGIISYLLLWLSTVWGLAVSNKILDPVLHRAFTYDFHQFLSLLAIGFVFLHIVVLLADQYLPFSVAQILVPFAAPYRPVWVGLGTIGLYLTLLVSITFYIRRWIGQKTFRLIHLVSYIAFRRGGPARLVRRNRFAAADRAGHVPRHVVERGVLDGLSHRHEQTPATASSDRSLTILILPLLVLTASRAQRSVF